MPLLLNNSTKQIENIPDADVTQAIATGAYSPRVGSRLNVVSSTGDIGTIDSAEAQAAFTGGWQYFSRDQAKEVSDQQIREVWREEFDRPGLAFAAGLLRGGTFGLSDVAARAIGGQEAAQNLRILEELSPKASTAGEVTGAVASLATPVGAGRIAAKVGTKVSEATIGKLAAKYGANSVLTRAAQMAAGTAIEGALFGTGDVISQAALDDPELSAQSALSTIGMGAAIGGAFGGLTKVGGEALGKFKQLLQESTTPTAAADTLGKLYSKVTSLTRGMDPADAAEMERLIGTREGRDLVFRATQDRSVNEKVMVTAVADLRKAVTDMKTVWGDARTAARAELSKQKVGPIRNLLNSQLKSTIDDALNALDSRSEFFLSNTAPALNQLKQALNEGFKQVKNREELHKMLQVNRELLDSKMKYSYFERSGDASRSEKVLAKVREKFSEIMTDKKWFGQFADDYKMLNDAYNGLSAVEKRVLKEFGEKTIDNRGKEILQISPQKIASFYRNPEKMTNANKLLNLDKLVASTDYMANIIKQSAGGKYIDPEALSLLTNVANNSKSIVGQLKDARVAEMFLNNLETRTGKSMIGTVLGAIAGTPGGIPGQILGGALGAAVATPRSFLNILFTIENHGIAGQQRLQNSVSKFLGNKKYDEVLKRVEPLTKAVTIKGALEYLGYHEHSKDEIMDLKNIIDDNVQNPQKMWHTFNENNPHIEDIAPVYSQEMMNTMYRGMQFLQQKLPQYRQDMFATGTIGISDSQKRQLSAYVDTIFRPGKIFDELQSGRIDPLTVETIQSVYPALYANIQKEVLMQASDNSKMSYHKKLVLGKLFAVPTTAGLAQIDKLQNSFIQQNIPQSPKKPLNLNTIARHQSVADSLQM